MRIALGLALLTFACDGHTPATWPAGGGPNGGGASGGVAAAPRRSTGCARTDPARGVVEPRFASAGRSRTATIVAPSEVGPAYPVVFVLHGDGGSGAQIRAASHLEEQAKGRALFVYPDGMVDLDTPAASNADIAMFDSLVAYVQSQWCVDPGRIFVTGFSKGGYMANQLGCRRGDLIRGVAAQSGGGPYENKGSYDDEGHLRCNGKPVASLVIHGLADAVVPASEGQNSVDHWSHANQCGATRASRGGCVVQQGCINEVADCKVPGLGHAIWPSAAATIWAFFDAMK